MAQLSSSNQKTHCHARSTSFPSTSIPLFEIDEQLCRSHASSEATSSSSSSSVCNKLTSLKALYDSLDSFLLSTTTQQAMARGCDKKWVNESLDGLLRLLDMCNTAKEALCTSKDSAQELQSVLRRKRGDMHAIQEYHCRRKTVKKAVQKAMRELRRSGNEMPAFVVENQETMAILTTLKEVESVTSRVFESLLSFIFGTKSQARPNGWHLVSKLVAPKRVACHESLERSEFEKVDHELFTLIGHNMKNCTSLPVEIAHKELVDLQLSLQHVEEGLECIYRHLIRTRVSLLNILNC